MKIISKKSNIRIDVFLAKELNISRSKVQTMIEKVLVNDETVDKKYLLQIGDEIFVEDFEDEDVSLKAEDIRLDIVYEDEYLLVINKASGMVVHPAAGVKDGTLVNAVLAHTKIDSKDLERPGIVHRLDKDTSGLMIVAKSDKIRDILSQMLKERKITRKYKAIVDGLIHHETGTIDAPIGRDSKNRQKMAVTTLNSKEAITYFRVIERLEKHSFIECTLETGRTHQIRVHISNMNHPVVGDPVYSKIKNEFKIEKQLLHSKSLTFIHPISQIEMSFKSDLPNHFKSILEKLEKEF